MDDNRPFGKPGLTLLFDIAAAVVCGFFAFFILLESPLNPWSECLAGTDSSIFIYMGEGLLKGKVPYTEMFDHKGPFLWTIEYAGLLLGGGRTVGIWILELIALTFDIFMAYLIAGSVIKHRFEALVSACLSFVPLIYFLYGGNLSEEWSLPFIYAGLYIYLQYFTGKRREIRALDVAAEGVLCGLVLMIRVNGACVFAVFSVVLLIWLLLKKDISGAVKCIVSFFAGVLASFLPFAIWYASKGALKEMWEVYISFNMYYSELHGGFSPGNVISLSVYFITRDPMLLLPFVTLLPVILLEKKDYWRFVFYLFMVVSCLCAAMGGQPHVHYAMYLIPCLTVPIACTLSALLHFASKKGGNIGAIALRCVIIFVCVAYLRWDPPVGEQRHVFSRLKTIASEDQKMLDHIAQNTEPGDDILVTGLNARIYYASGHLCGSRRFIQHFMYDYDGALMKEMLDYVDTDPPRLIILPLRNVDGDPWGEWMTAFDSELRKRMSEGHFVRYSDDVFVAYRSVED